MSSFSLFVLVFLVTIVCAASTQPSLKSRNIAQFLQSSIEITRASFFRPNASNQLDGCLGPALLHPHGLFEVSLPLRAVDFAVDQAFVDSMSEFTAKVLVTSRAPNIFPLQLSFGELDGGGELKIGPSTSLRFLFAAKPFQVTIEMELLLTDVEISIANATIEPLNLDVSIIFLNHSLSDFDHKLEDFMAMNALDRCLQRLTDVLRSFLSKQLKLVTRNSIENGSVTPRAPRTPRTLEVQFFNHKVNQLVAKLKKKVLKNAKRIQLPEFSSHFSKKILFAAISGGFNLFHGKLVDISDLKRRGDIIIEIKTHTYIDIPLELKNVAVSYRSRFYLTFITVRPHFTVTTDHVRFHLQARTLYGYGTEIKKVQITSLGRIDVQVKNLYPLNWLFSAIATLISNSYRELIIPHLESIILQKAKALHFKMQE